MKLELGRSWYSVLTTGTRALCPLSRYDRPGIPVGPSTTSQLYCVTLNQAQRLRPSEYWLVTGLWLKALAFPVLDFRNERVRRQGAKGCARVR